MPLDIAAEARSWRDSHGGPGETTPEQIFCLQLLTERMWRAAAPIRRSEIVRTNNEIALVTLRDYKEC
jgi:hypothetical protein